jgi:hypothetical protein
MFSERAWQVKMAGALEKEHEAIDAGAQCSGLI